MGLIRRIGRAVRRVGSFAKKAISFAQKPLGIISKLTAPLQKLADKVLDKLPFGQFLKPFVNNFLSNPLSFLGMPGLGALGGLASQAAGLGKLGQLAGSLDSAVGGLSSQLMPPALHNVSEIFAHSQAQKLLGRL